jgi:16S rRNA C967 or C1407 C5-methylase (RsmB/RsmF family)/NOL1/NOP2/fmu family ribosome biogenesis protein
VQLPVELIRSLQGVKGFDEDAFKQVHTHPGRITSIRLNPLKPITGEDALHLHMDKKIPWSSQGFYLTERPSFTFDPLFHAGCYYVQEASSMFLEQAMVQHTDLSQPIHVLDLSAAPGGKSTHLQSLLAPGSLLVSNDVIRSRANILRDNLVRWGAENVIVTQNDPRDFSALQNYFDLIVVDAPCSGSGLFRRDAEAMEEWSLNNVALCSQRQQRILADVWPALKENGLLVYSTCSYSVEEDEQILDWLKETFDVAGKRIQINEDWGIVEVERHGNYGYRFWPDKIKGEGFFLSCLVKNNGSEIFNKKNKKRTATVSQKEASVLEKWISRPVEFCRMHENIFALPPSLKEDIFFLLDNLRVISAGVEMGTLIRDKLVPAHALALSNLCSKEINSLSLSYEDAIRYLQRKEMSITARQTGWQLAEYKGHALGWINALPGRINNYYPKQLRILKDN